MSNSNILSVREMIDMAFGDSDVNIVNFKIIQTILYLLAHQLRVLERRVEVNLDPSLSVASQSSITVTEVKMHASVPKRKKRAEGEMIYKEDDISVAGKTLKQLGDTKEKKRFKNIDSVVPLSEKRPLDKSDPLTNRPESKINDNVSTEQIFEKGSGHKTYQNITNYQEQLTQMQNDLETCLENMAEALANTGGDAAAVAELNAYFTNLQEDFDKASIKQKGLQEMQDSLHLDLKTLWQQIEQLRDTKPDREEVSDALRDKAGLEALNGLVSQQHFDAVRGDFQKSISAAYEKFNNQELIWQKAIDEIFNELNEKADLIQVNSLRDDINKNIEMLNNRIQTMVEILGEPRAAATTRKMFRDAACLSCASPAIMEPTVPNSVPKLPPFTNTLTKHKLEAETMSKLNGDGDYDICYPGRPIPHPIDSRSHHYCGGRIAMDKPCITCNKSNVLAMQLLKADQAPEKPGFDSFEINPSNIIAQEESQDYRSFDKDNTFSVTPTLLLDDEDI